MHLGKKMNAKVKADCYFLLLGYWLIGYFLIFIFFNFFLTVFYFLMGEPPAWSWFSSDDEWIS